VEEGYSAEPEPNPFLGWRGIRLSLGRQDLFKRQLRALLRAGAWSRVGIMFPMVTTVEEVLAAKELLKICAAELDAEKIAAPSELLVGAMIEVPGAALIAGALAQHVDFLSLGTNDLVQYTLAVDRLNDRVADLYQTTHPAVLRLIAMTIESGQGGKVRVGMCGEMAADISLTPLLLGMGMRELSVSTSQVARVKEAVRRLALKECQDLWAKAQRLTHAADIRKLSLQLAESRYPDLFE
jgi:phosphotransferase system enzyme I (PtsI)